MELMIFENTLTVEKSGLKLVKKEIYLDIISFIGFPTIVGCDGDTRCGNNPVNAGEFRNNGVMATFNFQVYMDIPLILYCIY